MKYVVLCLAAALALSGCGGHADQPTAKHSTLVPAPTVGTVEGRLLHAGGPSGAGSGPWPGDLLVVGPDTHLTASVGEDGRYSLLLRPGRYTITATSPRYDGGNAVCRTEPPVTVITAEKTVTTDVICPVR